MTKFIPIKKIALNTYAMDVAIITRIIKIHKETMKIGTLIVNKS